MNSKMSLKELQALELKGLARCIKTYDKKDDIVKRINIFEAKKIEDDLCRPVQKYLIKLKRLLSISNKCFIKKYVIKSNYFNSVV